MRKDPSTNLLAQSGLGVLVEVAYGLTIISAAVVLIYLVLIIKWSLSQI